MQATGTHKVKKVMEIISLINNCFQARERETRDLEREIKRYECRLDIAEKEKNLCKQQLELVHSSNGMGQQMAYSSQQQNNSFLKRSPIGKELSTKLQ